MGDFYIKKITVTGKGKKDSVVEFSEGLNIICGPSNTGKSYVVECIDFIFGSKKNPFDESLGFDTVKMVVGTRTDETITLERQFGKNKTNVSSTVPGIDSGEYSNNKSQLYLNNLWLTLIGIKDEHQVIANERGESQTLTWRTFLHTFLIREEDVLKTASIFQPQQATARTASLAALLFLISGKDYNQFVPEEKKEIKEAKKKAVIDYINRELARLSERKGRLDDEMHSLNSIDIEKEMRSIIDEISETEKHIAEATKHSRDMLKRIYEISAKLEECRFLHESYKKLESQYVSDTKRLRFIVEGEANFVKVPENKQCPFCESDLPVHEHTSYIETSQAELARIISQQEDLMAAEEDIALESKALEEELIQLRKENDKVISLINKELNPKAKELKEALTYYRNVIRVQNEQDIIKQYANSMGAELWEKEHEEEVEKKFKPKDYFGKDTIEKINEYLQETLQACSYENLVSVRLSLESFDVVVNGKEKETFGKGYRAFLNTVLAFTFMRFLSEHGEYAPSLLIIDSPILSLIEPNEQATDGMKSSLFHYLLGNQGFGQVIIVENNIPKLDYKKASVIHFTMDEEKGRYGFLEDVYN